MERERVNEICDPLPPSRTSDRSVDVAPVVATCIGGRRECVSQYEASHTSLPERDPRLSSFIVVDSSVISTSDSRREPLSDPSSIVTFFFLTFLTFLPSGVMYVVDVTDSCSLMIATGE